MIFPESLREVVLEAILPDPVFETFFLIIKKNLVSYIILEAVRTDLSGERLTGKTNRRRLLQMSRKELMRE